MPQRTPATDRPANAALIRPSSDGSRRGSAGRATAAVTRRIGYIRVPYVRMARPRVGYVHIRYVRMGA